MKIVVTAGPTREHMDDVRFLTNASSGRMGHAVAGAALLHGHQVHLITGPTSISPPEGASVVNVITALEMRDALLEIMDDADALVMTAAVSDWRPKERLEGKIDKKDEIFPVELVLNPDVLLEATRRHPGTLAIAFALETEMDTGSALRKMSEKGADLVVLNTVAAMGAEEAEFAVFSGPGDPVISGRYSKEDIAEALIGIVEKERGR